MQSFINASSPPRFPSHWTAHEPNMHPPFFSSTFLPLFALLTPRLFLFKGTSTLHTDEANSTVSGRTHTSPKHKHYIHIHDKRRLEDIRNRAKMGRKRGEKRKKRSTASPTEKTTCKKATKRNNPKEKRGRDPDYGVNERWTFPHSHSSRGPKRPSIFSGSVCRRSPRAWTRPTSWTISALASSSASLPPHPPPLPKAHRQSMHRDI